MFHTGMHDDCHRPSDTSNSINNAGMTQVTRLVFALVYDLAERRAALPGFRAAARHETPETEEAIVGQAAPPADRLGVEWIEEAARTGGVLVSRVEINSSADRAGLREGDCIEVFAGRNIHSDDDFFAAVSSAESPASLRVKRPKAAKPLELTVSLLGSPLRWGIAWTVDDAEPGAVVLAHVAPASPAARAGLRSGDRIYQVAGRDFADETAFARLVKTHADSLQLLIERDGRLRSVVLRLQQINPAKRAA
jgi:S1-C subfamily serine protease